MSSRLLASLSLTARLSWLQAACLLPPDRRRSWLSSLNRSSASSIMSSCPCSGWLALTWSLINFHLPHGDSTCSSSFPCASASRCCAAPVQALYLTRRRSNFKTRAAWLHPRFDGGHAPSMRAALTCSRMSAGPLSSHGWQRRPSPGVTTRVPFRRFL